MSLCVSKIKFTNDINTKSNIKNSVTHKRTGAFTTPYRYFANIYFSFFSDIMLFFSNKVFKFRSRIHYKLFIFAFLLPLTWHVACFNVKHDYLITIE